MEPKRKHYFARIPTIALLVIFAMAPWLAVLLFILRAIDRDMEKKERAEDAYSYDFRAEDTREAARATADPDYLYGHDTPTEEQKKAKKWQKDLADLCTFFGGLFLIIGLLNIGDIPSAIYIGDFSGVISTIAQILGGGGALTLGLSMNQGRKLERQLDKIVGSRDNIKLDELFAAAGISADKGRVTLESAIDHGYFGADAYIDNRTDTLVVRGPAPQPPKPAEPEQPKAPQTPEDEYERLLRQLGEANAAIANPEMKAKITRLEQLSAHIFALAKKDAGKAPQLKKFMDYYLPTALKLLNTYAQFEAQGFDGQNITEAKRNIERSMDMLVKAFENQLDKLYQSDALDVTADVAALEGMLNLDGLAGSDFDQSGKTAQ